MIPAQLTRTSRAGKRGDDAHDGRFVADVERDRRVPRGPGFRRRGAGDQHLAAKRRESGGDAVADAAGAADHQDAPAGEQAGRVAVSG